MAIEVSVSDARRRFGELCDAAVDDETILIHRVGVEDVALVAADELRALQTTIEGAKRANNFPPPSQPTGE
jgi:prevent-host-death family protein